MLIWLLDNKEDGIKYFSSPLKPFVHKIAAASAPALTALAPASLLPYPHFTSACSEARSQEDTKTSGDL